MIDLLQKALGARKRRVLRLASGGDRAAQVFVLQSKEHLDRRDQLRARERQRQLVDLGVGTVVEHLRLRDDEQERSVLAVEVGGKIRGGHVGKHVGADDDPAAHFVNAAQRLRPGGVFAAHAEALACKKAADVELFVRVGKNRQYAVCRQRASTSLL